MKNISREAKYSIAKEYAKAKEEVDNVKSNGLNLLIGPSISVIAISVIGCFIAGPVMLLLLICTLIPVMFAVGCFKIANEKIKNCIKDPVTNENLMTVKEFKIMLKNDKEFQDLLKEEIEYLKADENMKNIIKKQFFEPESSILGSYKYGTNKPFCKPDKVSILGDRVYGTEDENISNDNENNDDLSM